VKNQCVFSSAKWAWHGLDWLELVWHRPDSLVPNAGAEDKKSVGFSKKNGLLILGQAIFVAGIFEKGIGITNCCNSPPCMNLSFQHFLQFSMHFLCRRVRIFLFAR
jgi:hypothetical protein